MRGLAPLKERKGARTWISRFVLSLGAICSFAVPSGFVQLAAPLQSAVFSLTVLACIIAIVQVLSTGGGSQTLSLLLIGIVVLASGLPNGRFSDAAIAASPVLIGLAYGRYVTFRGLVWIVHIMVMILILEFATKQHIYSSLFGSQLFGSYLTVDFRPRGIFGQAVPGALTGIAISGSAMVWAWLGQYPKWLIGVLAAESLVLSFITGTRSSLVLLALLVVIVVMIQAGRKGQVKVGGAALALATAGVSAGVAGLLAVPRSFWSSRVFDFASLSESASGIVRVNGLATVGQIADSCGTPCRILGHGVRSLQSELIGGRGRLGFSTIDNLYISLYWDVGILGLAVAACAAWVFLRGFSARPPLAVVAASVAGTLVLASGLFFDALYVRPTAFVFGACLGLILWRKRPDDVLDNTLDRERTA